MKVRAPSRPPVTWGMIKQIEGTDRDLCKSCKNKNKNGYCPRTFLTDVQKKMLTAVRCGFHDI